MFYRGLFENQKGPGINFPATCFLEFLDKTFSLVTLHTPTKFQSQTVFTFYIIQQNVFLVSCFGISWRHDIWISAKFKFDYLKNEKSFRSETKNIFPRFKVLFCRHTKQSSKNVANTNFKAIAFVISNSLLVYKASFESTSFVKCHFLTPSLNFTLCHFFLRHPTPPPPSHYGMGGKNIFSIYGCLNISHIKGGEKVRNCSFSLCGHLLFRHRFINMSCWENDVITILWIW